MTILVRNFCTYGDTGEMETLQCKLCGRVIGEKGYRSLGLRRMPNGQMIERVVEGFMRNHLYCEMKIEFEDGSQHVTNGCKDCLVGLKDAAILQELEECDMSEQKLKARSAGAIDVLEVKVGGGVL